MGELKKKTPTTIANYAIITTYDMKDLKDLQINELSKLTIKDNNTVLAVGLSLQVSILVTPKAKNPSDDDNADRQFICVDDIIDVIEDKDGDTLIDMVDGFDGEYYLRVRESVDTVRNRIETARNVFREYRMNYILREKE